MFLFNNYIYFFISRIPLPELKDSDKLDKIMYMKETTKRIRLGPDTLPSICFYSFLNAYQVILNYSRACKMAFLKNKQTNKITPLPLQGLTGVDVTDDSSLIAGGFADSTVRVWSVTPKKLRKVKSAAGTSQRVTETCHVTV